MINSRELRIGNLVHDPNHYGGGRDIVINEICYNHETKYWYDGLIPIPLTEEWLVKFGFRKMSESVYVCDMFSLLKTEFCFKYDGFTELHYVHQLQNLAFALTGEEL